MTKGPDAFRTISEVAEELNVPQHVLRFWETRFSQIRPLKRSGGRRFYRPDDVALLRGIRYLLYGAGYTIRGVQRILKEQGIAHVQRIAPPSGDKADGLADVARADAPAADAFDRDESHEPEEDFGDTAAGLSDSFADDDAAADDEPAGSGADDFPRDLRPPHAASYDAHAGSEAVVRAAPDAAVAGDRGWRDAAAGREPADEGAGESGYAGGWEQGVEAGSTADGPGHAAATPQPGAITAIDPVINRYAPGPLSSRSERAGTPRPEASDNQIIQPQYRLTTDTREHLQAVLDEIRECRRLLNSALSRLQD